MDHTVNVDERKIVRVSRWSEFEIKSDNLFGFFLTSISSWRRLMKPWCWDHTRQRHDTPGSSPRDEQSLRMSNREQSGEGGRPTERWLSSSMWQSLHSQYHKEASGTTRNPPMGENKRNAGTLNLKITAEILHVIYAVIYDRTTADLTEPVYWVDIAPLYSILLYLTCHQK